MNLIIIIIIFVWNGQDRPYLNLCWIYSHLLFYHCCICKWSWNEYTYKGNIVDSVPGISCADQQKIKTDMWLCAPLQLTVERALLETSADSNGDRLLRKQQLRLLGPLPEVPRKPRKQLTPEELDERRRKVWAMSKALLQVLEHFAWYHNLM